MWNYSCECKKWRTLILFLKILFQVKQKKKIKCYLCHPGTGGRVWTSFLAVSWQTPNERSRFKMLISPAYIYSQRDNENKSKRWETDLHEVPSERLRKWCLMLWEILLPPNTQKNKFSKVRSRWFILSVLETMICTFISFIWLLEFKMLFKM